MQMQKDPGHLPVTNYFPFFFWFLNFPDSSQMYRSKTKKTISVKENYSMKKDDFFFHQSHVIGDAPWGSLHHQRKQLFTQRDQNIRTTRNPGRLGISGSEKLSNAWNWCHNHSVCNFQKIGDW